ncbi:MAG: DUF4340 domain-containing protein [Opitutaceae bacterium]|jgi:hypothetical protein|nr:DUF4340 domain-containing protein [Opitutaceae bacterium]
MKLKTLLLTVLILAALSGATWFATRPPSPPPTPEGNGNIGAPVAPAAKIAEATRVRITDDGKTIELARQPDGAWHVTSYYDLPADFPKLTRLIADLTGAKIDRFVSARPEVIDRLEFKGTQIAIYGAPAPDAAAEAAPPLWSLDLGRTAETGGGRYIRYTGEDKAYLARLNIWLDTEPKNWADSALTTLKPADIAKAEFTFPEGDPLAVTRKDKDAPFDAAPARAGHTVKADAITTQLNNLTGLRLSNTAEPAAPDAVEARNHARTVKLTTFDNRTLTIALGRRPAEPAKPAEKPATDKQPADTANPAAAAGSGETAAAGEQAPPSTDADKPVGTPAAAEPGQEDTGKPAGPVYVFMTDTKADAPVNALMKKRAVEVYEFVYTSLPAKADDLFALEPSKAATPTSEPATPDQ